MFQFKSEGRKESLSQFEGGWAERILSSSEEVCFCSAQAFIGLQEAHPHWEEQSALLSLLIQMLNPMQKHPQRHTQKDVSPNVCAPIAQSETHKISHYHRDHLMQCLHLVQEETVSEDVACSRCSSGQSSCRIWVSCIHRPVLFWPDCSVHVDGVPVTSRVLSNPQD